MAPRVMTVSGPIPPEKLGFTLPHEHTAISLWHIANRWDYWELTPDDDLMIEELRDFRRRGGSTLVDLTPPGVGRDPDRLRRLASASNINIVMGTGWYREAYYPAEARIDRRTVDDLAAEIVREVEHGVGESGIRPGIIGEIGTDKPWVSALEERVHRAAARAAKRTGLALTTHGVQSAVGIEEALEPRLVETIVELLERGFGEQLLLSQDVCHNAQLKANGGFGYVYLQQHFLPTLRTAAVGEGEIRQMTIENPARILTIP